VVLSKLSTLRPYHCVVIPLGILLFAVAIASLRWRMEHDAPVLFYLARLMDQYHYIPYKDFFDINISCLCLWDEQSDM
jgi:hypothetical protein